MGQKFATKAIFPEPKSASKGLIIGYAFEAIALGAQIHARLRLRGHRLRLRRLEGLRLAPAAGGTFMGTWQEHGDVGTLSCAAIVESKDLIGCAAQ